MRFRHAFLRGPALAAVALAASLALLPHAARAGDAGEWQLLYGPPQNGGAMAFDEGQHRLLVWGGGPSTRVQVLPLDGFPYSWSVLPTMGAAPAPRSGHALVHDPVHDRLIVFGGLDTEGHALADVWQLTLTGTPTWSEIATTGTAPDPRLDFGACFDPYAGRLYVFGGLDADGIVMTNALHVLDLNGPVGEWTQPDPSGDVPSGRWGSPLALDLPGDRLLLFGGNDGSSDLGDAYEMDLATFTWSAVPASGIPPDPRSDHLCAWNPNTSRLLVWGGTAADDSLRALDMGTHTWSSLPCFIGPPQHGARREVGVMDPAWNRLLVLAGPAGAEIHQFQFLDPTGYWYSLGPTGFPVGGSFVTDRANHRAVAYGGYDWAGRFTRDGFWQFAFTAPIGWNGVNTGGVPPPARSAHLAVWDQQHDRMLVIAGRDENLALTNSVYALSDSADFMNWKGLAPAGAPPSPRQYASGIYDPVGDRVLLYGGMDLSGVRNGVHQLSLTPSPAWSTIAASGGPAGRAGASAIYDEPRRRMVLFGGIDSLGNHTNETWALSLPGLAWTHLATTGTPPGARWKHTAVYDSRRGRMLVFGGRVTSADSADTWELDLAASPPAWTRLAPGADLPLFRSEAGAVYDSTGDRMLVYGGGSLISLSTAIGNQDLWALQFATTSVDAPPLGEGESWSVGAPTPNPARGPVTLAFALARPASVRAAVYDVAGRRQESLADGLAAAGRHVLTWSGRDADGRRVASGIYFWRLELDGRPLSRKVIVVQ